MLSYMIPVEEKPPPVPNKNHLQLQLELQQQQQQQNSQHHNHVGPASSPLPTVHPESDGRKVIIKTSAGGVKTTLSSESSVSSISSSDVASSTTMTPTDKPKPKLLVNGTKHASLKRWANLPYTLHVLVVSAGGLWGFVCQERNAVVGRFCCNVLNANRNYLQYSQSTTNKMRLFTIFCWPGAARSSNGLTLYVQFWAPDGGRKTRLKHVERLTKINKLKSRILLVVLREYISDARTYQC